MSTPDTPKTKASQLERTRRNQQRCRERKRAYVAELQSEVEALKGKIRQCEPCTSSAAPVDETALMTATRENAARAELLRALGFDDVLQRRFIDSALTRHALQDALGINEDEAASMSFQQPALLSNVPAITTALGTGSALTAEISDFINDASGSFAPTHEPKTELKNGSRIAGVNQTWPTTLDINGPATTATFPPVGQDDDWMWSPHDLPDVPDRENSLQAQSQFDHRLPASFDIANLNQDFSASASTTNGTIDPNALPPATSPVEQCFLNTVIKLQADETTTACSAALSMVLSQNRLGLSLAQLQERLKPGLIPNPSPAMPAAECRVQNSVLFRVLADITV